MALIALGVSGGIGAYKAVEIARGLQKHGHDVVAVMTRSATRFVGPLTFEAITRREVITDQWKPGANADIEHIAIASTIDLLLVAPATANIIGKFANGIADDFLSSLYLATRAPVLMAPAMNTNMFEHPAVVQESRDAGGARRAVRRSGRRAIWRAAGSAKAGWPNRPTWWPRPSSCCVLRPRASRLAGTARARHRRSDLRRHRSGAIRRQSIERPHGLRAGGRGAAARRRGDAGDGPDAPDAAARRRGGAGAQRRRDARGRDGARRRHATSSIMAAAVADYTPAETSRRRRSRRRDGPLTITLHAHEGHSGRPRPAAVARSSGCRCSSASPPKPTTCVAHARASSSGRPSISSSPTTCRAAGRRLRRRHQRGDAGVAGEAAKTLPLQSKSAVAARILDRVEQLLAAVPAARRHRVKA